MTSIHGVLTYDSVCCSYQLTARRQRDGVVLTAMVRPMLRDDEASGGREAVIPCAEHLARELMKYAGGSRKSAVHYDYLEGSAQSRLHVPTPLSSRALLAQIDEVFDLRYRVA